MATVVVIITSMVAANATQSLTTPNAAFNLIQSCGGREQRADYAGHQQIGAGHWVSNRTPGRGPCETVGDAVDPPSQETEC
jgi:hypothetical protein